MTTATGNSRNESEETKVKKDKQWAIKETKETINGFFDRSSRGVAQHYEDELIASIADIINQLDEPEVLSQEWIDEHEIHYNHWVGAVPVTELQNLLVPKQEELEVKIQELIERYRNEDGKYSNPENAWIDEFIEDLENLLEEEQKYVIELPNITGSEERYLVQGDDGALWIDGGLDYLQKYDIPKHTFTEEEIKSFDTKYMTFAKPIEELEE